MAGFCYLVSDMSEPIGYRDPIVFSQAGTGDPESGYCNCSAESVDVWIEYGPISIDVIVDGEWQPGWSGTITETGSYTHQYEITEHPSLLIGTWTLNFDASCGEVIWVTDQYFDFEVIDPGPSYLSMLEFVLPPWLLRTEGIKLVRALASVIDDHRNRAAAGVKLRFPGLYSLEGVDKLGSDRRLRRGPNEDSAVYADRLKRWWEDHRTRGGAYALLEQMLAYLDGTLDPPYDVVSYRGVRHVMDANEDITRDIITWGTDENDDYWSRIWVFVYTTASSVTDEVLESYAAIVRDWIPAHIVCELVVIHPGTRLWGYPQPVPEWGDWTWGGPIGGGPTIIEV